MANMDIQHGDIPETDAELEKVLAKKPVSKRGKKQTPVVETAANHEPGQQLPEDTAERAASGSGWQGEAVEEKPEVKKQPVQQVLKHKEIVFHGQINGMDVYGYNSQEILDMADKAYAFYGTTPVIQL